MDLYLKEKKVSVETAARATGRCHLPAQKSTVHMHKEVHSPNNGLGEERASE